MLSWWQLLSIGFLAGMVMMMLMRALYGLVSTVADAVRNWKNGERE